MSSPERFPRQSVRRWLRRAGSVLAVASLCALLATEASEAWLRSVAAGHVFAESDVPAAPVALVLGAQVDPGGIPSVFLTARLELARQLYADGRVRALLVSGDHGRYSYDEPDAMKSWLIGHGVPAVKVVLDHAGFDTYDSCDRAVRVFGVHRVIVVTQGYHVARAVALCRRLGLDADGVGDDTVEQYAQPWLISSTREHGACVKAVLDLASGRDPVFLGRHETGIEDALRSD